jgi:hypothetical protein
MPSLKRRLLMLALRAACWATLCAAAITVFWAWRSPPESTMTWPVALTLFGVLWVLSFVPSLVMELLNTHVGLEIGKDDDNR